MSCQECSHTMQGLGKVESGMRYFWCPRCGTLKGDHELQSPDWSTPAGWLRAMDVLRQLVNGPDTDENVAACFKAAENILRDCDLKRKEGAPSVTS